MKAARTLLTAGLLSLAAGATALGAQPAKREAPAPSPADAAARTEVAALNKAMADAFNRGDMKAVAGFYAENAIVRSASWVDARGRAQVEKYWMDLAAPKSWDLQVNDVVDNGEGLLFQTGISTLVHGSPERTSRVAFNLVWKRQPDRSLRIVLDYYHSAGR